MPDILLDTRDTIIINEEDVTPDSIRLIVEWEIYTRK